MSPVIIQFKLPTNDGPILHSSTTSLTTNEDTTVTVFVWIEDSDFYELNEYGNNMRLNISVINGTIGLNSINGLYFDLGNGTNSRILSAHGELTNINKVKLLIYLFVAYSLR